MINIGKVNTLNIVKQQDTGVYLDGGASGEVRLVDKKLPENCEIGNALTVFVYLDSEGNLSATSKIPLAQVDDIAWG